MSGKTVSAERITGFDALRFCMVVFVVMLHSAMTYMEYAPQWWYVIDEHRSLFFTKLVIFLDSFPMTVLFFLSGYFAPPSFAKRGRRAFLKDKLIRIGAPWILGVALVAPFFAYASYKGYGLPPISAAEFVWKWFFGAFYQQSNYWFLGVLFVCMAVYGQFYAGYTGTDVREDPPRNAPRRLILILFSVSAAAYYAAACVKPSEEWVNIGYVLYFQHARIAGYIAVFALGAHAWRNRWFSSGGWSPNLTAWFIAALASSVLMLKWKFSLAPSMRPEANAACEAVLYNAASISMTFFLTGFFLKFQGAFGKITKFFTPHVYGIYWLQQIVLMPFLYIIKPYDAPAVLKFAVSIPVNVLVCFLLDRYILKKTPFF
jgi:peptidoglycan/LPS O-acetylase OafA/YrhL